MMDSQLQASEKKTKMVCDGEEGMFYGKREEEWE